jgi:hypothetical protein
MMYAMLSSSLMRLMISSALASMKVVLDAQSLELGNQDDE